MKEFMLLFRGADDYRRELSPEEKQAHFKRWMDWVSGIAQAGQLAGGQPLYYNTGRVVSGPAKKVTDGPFIEGKEMVGGYTIVKVDNFEAAVEIAKTCPNLEGESGTVEVREISAM